MSYIHFGRIGDIWKHLPLCTFLVNENPRFYIETNSAYPKYPLSHSPERDYGIYTFLNNAHKSKLLLNSEYFQVLNHINGSEYNTLPGSPGLALNILTKACEKYIFCDIEKESLIKIKEYANELNLKDIIETHENDSIKTIYSLFDKFNPLDFIHIDPYSIFEENDINKSYFDLFIDSVKRNIKTMLWYGYETNYQKRYLYNYMKDKFKVSNSVTNGSKITSIELYLSIIQENEVIVNPGVVGCGVMVGNLSQKSMDQFDVLSDELVKMYKNTKIYRTYSGELVKNKFCL